MVSGVRTLIGKKETPGTIRGDLCNHPTFNVIHGSDSIENAKSEIDLWFPSNDFYSKNLKYMRAVKITNPSPYEEDL